MIDLNLIVLKFSQIIWSWPLIITFILIGVLTTFMLYFIQFRYFLASWKFALFPSKEKTEGELSPFQALINAIGVSTGNGSIAGIATAIAAGGPGAAFWILIAGIFSLAIRFAEVYLATAIQDINPLTKKMGGGPMVYMEKIPGGKILTYLFTIFTVIFGIIAGSSMQSNSISSGIFRTWQINPYIIATVLFVFITYVLIGGAKRIISISDKLVPFKVSVFIISSFIVLIYNYKSLLPAIQLMFVGAFNPEAIGGAILGFTIQQAISKGFSHLLTANEAGLGTVPILFGVSGSKHPMKDSIMSMLSAFISTYLVCFVVALCIISSGVWNNGESSTALTISAFETVFGTYGGWIVTFCSVSFGLGVLVSYAFVTLETWLYVTNGRWTYLFVALYCIATFFGAIAKVDLVWNLINIINAAMLLINLYAIVYFLPFIRKSVADYIRHNKD